MAGKASLLVRPKASSAASEVPAARALELAPRLDARGVGGHDLGHLRAGETLAVISDARQDALAWETSRDEHHLAGGQVRDPLRAKRHALDV